MMAVMPGRAMVSRTMVICVAFAALCSAGAVVWDRGLKERFFPRDWGVVEPGQIYRSGQISRHLIEKTLRDNQIGLIVFLSGDKANRPDVDAEREVARRLGIGRINCPLSGDGTGDIAEYANAIQAIAKGLADNKRVLVHCATGAQRTGGVVAFWRVLVQGRSPQAAYRELLQYHHDPTANERLVPYLDGNMALMAKMLVDRHVIERVPNPLPIISP
jgi:protein tyrosine/serine phosphatase